MLPNRVSNTGPLTYESGALPIALRGPAANHLGIPKWDALTLKAPNTTAADDIYKYFFIGFQRK